MKQMQVWRKSCRNSRTKRRRNRRGDIYSCKIHTHADDDPYEDASLWRSQTETAAYQWALSCSGVCCLTQRLPSASSSTFGLHELLPDSQANNLQTDILSPNKNYWTWMGEQCWKLKNAVPCVSVCLVESQHSVSVWKRRNAIGKFWAGDILSL